MRFFISALFFLGTTGALATEPATSEDSGARFCESYEGEIEDCSEDTYVGPDGTVYDNEGNPVDDDSSSGDEFDFSGEQGL